MRFAMRFVPAMLAAGMLAISGCSHQTATSPTSPYTHFLGNVMAAGDVGKIAITIATANPAASSGAAPAGASPAGAPVSASAVMKISSGVEVVYLLGSYRPAANTLALAGSGWTLAGTLTGGVLRGTCVLGSESGVFVAQENGTGAEAVTTYCQKDGVLDGALCIRGGSVEGIVESPQAPHQLISFTGSFSAADSSIQVVDAAGPPSVPLGTGRLLTTPYTTLAQVGFQFLPGHTDWFLGSPCP
jgi:hypothetical protein